MIVADACVWIDHFARADAAMQWAARAPLFMHPYVLVELSLGSLKNRSRTLSDLDDLPLLLPIRQNEIVAMIERDQLYSTGLNFVDLHLLASARVTRGCRLWTRDKRLRVAAERFGVAADLN